jgi:hypothetical protein
MIEFIGGGIGALGLMALLGGYFSDETDTTYYILSSLILAFGLLIGSFA